ncbi:hypothetical protein C8Q78DRAFT_239963 [Trametes maxima]|nr:hypothetical protein C8Q78DRAFT_239963 [Trametes maxima]
MTVFSFKKRISKSKSSSKTRKVRFTEPTVTPGATKAPLMAAAIRLRAPSPFPRAHSTKPSNVTDNGKWRKNLRGRRPILVKKGTAGAEETSSDAGTSSGEDKIIIGPKANLRPQDTRCARYEHRTTYKTGDRVLVRDFEGRRSIWRHGVVADLREHVPQYVASYGGLCAYPVFYEAYGQREMSYFRPMRFGMMYDKVLSAASSQAEPRK